MTEPPLTLSARLALAERHLSESEARARVAEGAYQQMRGEAVTLLMLDRPWSVPEIVKRLTAAADHLLREHNCDTHGWEGITYARDAGLAWVRDLATRHREPRTEYIEVTPALRAAVEAVREAKGNGNRLDHLIRHGDAAALGATVALADLILSGMPPVQP